ncbi:MAG: DUF192 domain-containing protein [Candidatus Curtissbacteria bacterium]|nr:DUF192 domain-containing protein [Candidatus Curtissbacteria bacterium]
MKKDLSIIFGLFLLVIGLLVFGQGFTTTTFLKPARDTGSQNGPKESAQVTIKTLSVNAKIAADEESRKNGLSKRDSLPLNEGLLFVFPEKGNFTFWMKDMKFAIDIIWLDENKRVVHIVHNAPPEPDSSDRELTKYSPPTPAVYVLEVNAGLANLNGVQIDDQANFEL